MGMNEIPEEAWKYDREEIEEWIRKFCNEI